MRSLLTAPLLFLASCASLDFDQPDSEFGPQPSAPALQTTANSYLDQVMFDPEAKRIRWVDQQPQRAALWRGLIGGGWNHGWGMRFGLNGKNRMGGYVGERAYYVIQVGETVYVGEGAIEVDNKPAAPVR
ncbi:MAG: hypothetical protein AB7O97_02885 [Planctomycetota bacterium]